MPIKLKVPAKGGKQTIIHRPVQKLIAFEIAENSTANNCSDEREVTNENENEMVERSDVLMCTKLDQTTERPDERLR